MWFERLMMKTSKYYVHQILPIDHKASPDYLFIYIYIMALTVLTF